MLEGRCRFPRRRLGGFRRRVSRGPGGTGWRPGFSGRCFPRSQALPGNALPDAPRPHTRQILRNSNNALIPAETLFLQHIPQPHIALSDFRNSPGKIHHCEVKRLKNGPDRPILPEVKHPIPATNPANRKGLGFILSTIKSFSMSLEKATIISDVSTSEYSTPIPWPFSKDARMLSKNLTPTRFCSQKR